MNRHEPDIDFDDDSAAANLKAWRYLGQIPDLKSVRSAANRGELPNDPIYVKALAKVMYEVTQDANLKKAIDGMDGKGKRWPFGRG